MPEQRAVPERAVKGAGLRRRVRETGTLAKQAAGLAKEAGPARRRRGHALTFRVPWTRRGRQRGTITVPPADEDEQRQWTRELAAVLCAVGGEMLRAGRRTTEVEDNLRDIATRYGVRARCFIVPTGLFVRAGGGADGIGGELDFAPVGGPDMRLDQVQAVDALVARMRATALPFDEVRGALEGERALPVRFSPYATVFGYVLLTVGLGALQHATLAALAGYAVLGLVVGVLRLLAKRFPVLQTALPVVAAALVTVLALRWSGPLLHEPAARLFVPPLIAFLPGSALTMGSVEVATGAVLSGVSRLAGGLNVLLLLAFGILIGTDVVPERPLGGPVPEALGAWAPWCGVLLLGCGFMLHHSAPRGALLWLLGALLVERAVQVAGSVALSNALGVFAAGAMLPLIASWIGRRSGTPDQVIFLPCFWLLVPGSTGLRGFSELLVSHDPSSLTILVNTVITVIAIALGVLVGAGFLHRTRLELAAPSPGAGGASGAASTSGETASDTGEAGKAGEAGEAQRGVAGTGAAEGEAGEAANGEALGEASGQGAAGEASAGPAADAGREAGREPGRG
ncbi:threonine/serine ThrE exporter family protein [Streptomyces iconiensis]|uniref:Threonine/serine exporter family protein n=1 Tax=Streptomyces iconiensis TaxID=1384038 RepID=A0ABT6ZR58_9ACTN|nr:threonine/serine exporter family protein [Streptomyces iconiensis]MDJ1131553.1 threonine/serine exporter family protein [Streptomyces iconiensis]